MAKHRRSRPEDPRPLHGYGLELENQRYISYNYRIDTIARSIIFGPILIALGLFFATADKDVIGDNASLPWIGALIALVGAAFFLASIYLAVRGLVHWIRHRKVYKAQMAVAIEEYEARKRAEQARAAGTPPSPAD